MKRLNLYQSLVIDIIEKSNNADKICIDIEYYKNIVLFAKKHGFFSHLGFIGSYNEWNILKNKLKLDFVATNKKEFLNSLGYSVVFGKKYLLALKQHTLELF